VYLKSEKFQLTVPFFGVNFNRRSGPQLATPFPEIRMNDDDIFSDCGLRCRVFLNQLILNRIQPQIKSRFASWSELPGLLSLTRKSQLPGAKPARRATKFQPLEPLARKMLEWFPGLAVDRRLPIVIRFSRPINDEMLFVVNWMVEQHFGMGPSVKLSLGLRPTAQVQAMDSPQLVRPLSHYFGEADATFWNAESMADIDALGSSVPVFLSLVFAEIDKLGPIDAELSDAELSDAPQSQRAGAASARQAHELAMNACRVWDSQAALIGIVSPVFEAERLGWPLTTNGQLRPHGAWHLRYWSERQQRQAEAWVPFSGQAEFRRFVDPAFDNAKPIDDKWMDSPQAATLAASQNIAPQFKLSSMTLKGSQADSGAPGWQVCFAPERDFQHGTAISLDAVSGEYLHAAQA
jgi:hypothetical protein